MDLVDPFGARIRLRPETASVAAARRFIRQTTAEWDLGDAGPNLVLVVSELASNAVLHAGTEFTVRCTHLGDAVRLSVSDAHPGRTLPITPPESSPTRESGRGLALCAALASAWGVEYSATRKTVWCRLELTEPGVVESPPPTGPAVPAEALPVAAVPLQPDGRIREWPADATTLLGWAAEDLVGKPFRDLIVNDDDAHPFIGERLLRHRAGHASEMQLRPVPANVPAPTLVLVAPAEDPTGPLLAVDGVPGAIEPPPRIRLDLDRWSDNELPQRVAEAACDLVDGDMGYVLLLDADGDLALAGATGLSRDHRDYTEAVEPQPGQPYPALIPDLTAAESVSHPLRAAAAQSAVTAPLVVHDRVIGRIAIGSTRPDRFGRAQADALAAAANQVTHALDRARVSKLERDRRGWLGYLAEASELLAGPLDPRATVAMLAQLVVPRLATWCAVYVQNERGRPELWYTWHADETRIDALRGRLGDSPPPRPTRPAPTPWEEFGGPPGRVVASALSARGRVLGALVFGRDGAGGLPRPVLDLAEELSRRAGLLLDNALLNAEHVATSHALQSSLLPPRLPRTPGLDIAAAYRPAREGQDVGGDFYDVFPVAPDRWRFTIGDVAGSGPAAASVTGLARDALRILGRQGLPLEAVTAHLNELIEERLVDAGPTFLTLLHGELHRSEPDGSIEVRLVAAGHPLPYLLAPGLPPRTVGRHQPLLGVLPIANWTVDEVRLASGEALVCVTDGVLERRNGLRFLGEDGLDEVLLHCRGLSAAATANRIDTAVTRYSAAPPNDDLAVLVLRAVT